MISLRNDQMGCFTKIAAGVVCATLGDRLYSFFVGGDAAGMNWMSLAIAVV